MEAGKQKEPTLDEFLICIGVVGGFMAMVMTCNRALLWWRNLHLQSGLQQNIPPNQPSLPDEERRNDSPTYNQVFQWRRDGVLQPSLPPNGHSSLDEEARNDPGKLPMYKYAKEGLVRGGEIQCSVCLCSLKEGEEVRLLPQCKHLFHVPCIDMWLSSHSTCPLCRTEIATSQLLKVAPLAVE